MFLHFNRKRISKGLNMKIIFIGDVVGRSGREALKKYIPEIKKDFYTIDKIPKNHNWD